MNEMTFKVPTISPLQNIRKFLSFFENYRKKPSFLFFIENPSRTFEIQEMASIEKIYLILTSLNYEIIEQSLNENDFYLVALKEQPNPEPGKLIPFDKISVSLHAKYIENKHWQIRLVFSGQQPQSAAQAKYADLILENLTLALGWQRYWIIECPPPQKAIA